VGPLRILRLNSLKTIQTSEISRKNLLFWVSWLCKILQGTYLFYNSNFIKLKINSKITLTRPGVKEAIEKCKNAGINVIMITGDVKETAESIGQ